MLIEKPGERLAKRVRERRLDVGLSQGGLAAAAGVTAPSMSRIEGGFVDPSKLRWETVSGMSSALGVSPTYLLRGDQEADELLSMLSNHFARIGPEQQRQLVNFAAFLDQQAHKECGGQDDE